MLSYQYTSERNATLKNVSLSKKMISSLLCIATVYPNTSSSSVSSCHLLVVSGLKEMYSQGSQTLQHYIHVSTVDSLILKTHQWHSLFNTIGLSVPYIFQQHRRFMSKAILRSLGLQYYRTFCTIHVLLPQTLWGQSPVAIMDYLALHPKLQLQLTCQLHSYNTDTKPLELQSCQQNGYFKQHRLVSPIDALGTELSQCDWILLVTFSIIYPHTKANSKHS